MRRNGTGLNFICSRIWNSQGKWDGMEPVSTLSVPGFGTRRGNETEWNRSQLYLFQDLEPLGEWDGVERDLLLTLFVPGFGTRMGMRLSGMGPGPNIICSRIRNLWGNETEWIGTESGRTGQPRFFSSHFQEVNHRELLIYRKQIKCYFSCNVFVVLQ